MDARITIITLGVKNLKKQKSFYQKLGWKPSNASQGDIVFFQLSGGLVLALYPRKLLAKDAHVSAVGRGFQGFTLAQNVRTKKEVSKILSEAKKAGGKILKPAQDVFWGGHSGYFSDPEGNLWEVAWNPFFKMTKQGLLSI